MSVEIDNFMKEKNMEESTSAVEGNTRIEKMSVLSKEDDKRSHERLSDMQTQILKDFEHSSSFKSPKNECRCRKKENSFRRKILEQAQHRSRTR